MHTGAAVIIGNKAKTTFFIQRKDAGYPHPQFRHACSFWGGEIEATDSSPFDALLRELEEEIAFPFTFNKNSIRLVGKFKVYPPHPFHFYFYELLLDDKELAMLAQAKVFEGYSEMISAEELHKAPWILGMEVVFEEYMQAK